MFFTLTVNPAMTMNRSSSSLARRWMLPDRSCLARQMTNRCAWCMQGQYRGADCGYTGTRYYDKFGNPVDNPALDVCPGTVAGCKLRFGDDAMLPFGGFPAIGLLRM